MPPRPRRSPQRSAGWSWYRIYFGKDGDELVILLGGGKKKGQPHDIATAHARWKDYKQRKSQEK